MKQYLRWVAIGSESSPPARGRGLKPVTDRLLRNAPLVAPRTGAWIETKKQFKPPQAAWCRPPHGGVD